MNTFLSVKDAFFMFSNKIKDNRPILCVVFSTHILLQSVSNMEIQDDCENVVIKTLGYGCQIFCYSFPLFTFHGFAAVNQKIKPEIYESSPPPFSKKCSTIS
jgi:hypothetical protein